jgi:ABC-type transport system involved in multi-copper enzyme maturation permease subunit
LITTLIFSLLGVVLGFDAINGEKESGTLRLIVSNQVARSSLLTAKWLSGVIVLGSVLLITILWGALIIQVRSNIVWRRDDWLSMALILLVSLAYVTVFYSIAFFCSTVVQRSPISALAGIFSWVVLVLIVPNTSPFIAAQFVPLPSIGALERDLEYITSEERDELGRRLQASVDEKYPDLNHVRVLPREERSEELQRNPRLMEMYRRWNQEVSAAWDEANRIQNEKKDRLGEDFEQKSRQQFNLSKKISFFSPMPPYLYAVTDLALTGFDTRERFLEQGENYLDTLHRYSRNRLEEEKNRDPSFGWNDFIDLSNRPRFQFDPGSLGSRVNPVLGGIGLLLAWNLVLFLLSWLRFLRFDVR